MSAQFGSRESEAAPFPGTVHHTPIVIPVQFPGEAEAVARPTLMTAKGFTIGSRVYVGIQDLDQRRWVTCRIQKRGAYSIHAVVEQSTPLRASDSS